MRPIDADELLKLIKKHSYLLCDFHNTRDKGMFMCGIQQAVAEMPTVERKHGHWQRIDYYPVGHDYICSECNKKSAGGFNFCPYCGAIMNELKENENI